MLANEKFKLVPENLISLEQALLKVPLEQLRKAFKSSQKYVEKDAANLLSAIQELTLTTHNDVQEFNKSIDNLIMKAKNLKKKVIYITL
jgi:macrophage erythroblast attacher